MNIDFKTVKTALKYIYPYHTCSRYAISYDAIFDCDIPSGKLM